MDATFRSISLDEVNVHMHGISMRLLATQNEIIIQNGNSVFGEVAEGVHLSIYINGIQLICIKRDSEGEREMNVLKIHCFVIKQVIESIDGICNEFADKKR